MTDVDGLLRENEALRRQHAALELRATDAEQALEAFARGEVDAVTVEASSTPLLLRAAQAELVRSEQLFRAVFDGSLDAMFLADDDGRYLDANPAACALFGMARTDLVGRGASEFSAPEYDIAAAARDFAEHGRLRGRFPLVRADGTRRTLDFSAVASVLPGVNLSILRDVTDHIADEEARRRKEAQFRAVIEKSSEAISLSDRDGKTRYMTPSAWRLLGFTAEDVGAWTLRDQVVPEDRERHAAALAALVRGEVTDFSTELRVRHRDGSIVWIETTGTNLLDDPDVGAIIESYRDITARKRAEDALSLSERRYRRLIEDLPEPILVHVDGKIAFANAASAEGLGVPTAGELIGRSIAEFATPATAERIRARMTAVLEPDDQLEVAEQSFINRADGRELSVEVRSIAITYDGEPAILSIARDITRRVLAEREAARALLDADLGHRKLEAVLAALPVGVSIADAAGRLVQSNPAAARIWGGRMPHVGNPSEHGVYKAWWPATGAPLRAEEWALARTFATGETIVAEAMDIERFDGTRGHVLNSTAPVLDEQGRIVGGVAVLLDVSEANELAREREQLVASLEHERRRLGALFEKAPAFIAALRGKDHVFDLVNDAYRELNGGRDLVGKTVLEALPEIRGQGFVERLDAVLETGAPFIANGMPIMVARKSGAPPEQRYLNFVYQPIVEADGTRSGIFLHGVDVTDATIAQQRVRAQFHGIPVPTYIWQRVELDGAARFKLVDYNQAALTASNGEIADALGLPADAHFADVPEELEALARALEEQTTIHREIDRVSLASVEKRRLAMTYAAAPPDLVIVHAADVTERMKLEQLLRQSQKMEAIGRLAGGVAHDFNNILSVILSYASMALDDLKPGDPLRSDIVEIERAGQRATELTSQLLALSRQQVLQPRVVDLHDVVDGIKSMLRRLLREDIELTVSTTPGVSRVLADPGQLEQVLINLAVNARDAMPDGGKLTFETANVRIEGVEMTSALGLEAGDYALLAVSDTGIGMDAATRARIFEPFFTTKDVGKGTGLGLATVFGIVKQSGGSMSVYSEPGGGSTFKVYLPRTERSPDARVASMRPAPRQGSETILLVEDEAQVRAAACAILRRGGYRVLDASNGGEAFLIAKDFPGVIDLLLTDVVLPRVSGRKLAEELAHVRPDMKVLFASGYTDDAVILHGILDAGVWFLQKPFTPDSLLRKAREVLDAQP